MKSSHGCSGITGARMHSTLNYVSPVQFEQDWMEATVTIAA